MTFQELIVFLPCYSIESLSLNRDSEEAEQLLSAWSSLYHPALLAACEAMPRWTNVETPPEDAGGRLFVLPPCCEASLPADWLARAETAGARVVGGRRRAEILQAALADVPGADTVDAEVVGDFLALGFCHFEVELLTRQLRYMSNLDEMRFKEYAQEAARRAVAGDAAAAREQLRGAFDRLTEAREYFYPSETSLLDLTLVAPTTIGDSLRRELASGRTVNALISGETLDLMAQREPGTLEALRAALEAGTAGLLGGEQRERELPLLAPEDIVANFNEGIETYLRHLGRRPLCYARRRVGLTPLLPQILQRLGFVGALHVTLDDGKFPTGNQSKIRWEGPDGGEIETLARIPVDIRVPDGFFRMAEKLGHTMDLDQSATALFAHWPGQESPWYEDLRRMAAYGPALGRFHVVDRYFENTLNIGRPAVYKADEYRAPYLTQAVAADAPDPISRWTRYHRLRALYDAAVSLENWITLVAGAPAEMNSPPLPHPLDLLDAAERQVADEGAAEEESSSSTADASSSEAAPEATPAASKPEGAEEAAGQAGEGGDESQRAMETAARAALAARVEALARLIADEGPSSQGRLLVNPTTFARRHVIDVSDFPALPEVSGLVLAADESEQAKAALVEVPALGYTWVGPASPDAARPKRAKGELALLAEENVLRNEFFEVHVSPTGGAIQSLVNFQMRTNRLAQQVGLRLVDPRQVRRGGGEPGAEEEYTIMAADELSIVASTRLLGTIRSRGRLVDRRGKVVARFSQSMTARRGSRLLEVDLELRPERLPEPDPWASYYALRFAWSDETSEISRSVGLSKIRTESSLAEAPHYFEISASRSRYAVLTGGLPYYRRFGFRKLDTLLLVEGETARRFRFGIAVDAPHPAEAAVDFLLGGEALQTPSAAPAAPTGWLGHLDASNVQATAWEPIVGESGVTGFRARLLETDGRSARLGLRTFRDIASAVKTNFVGEEPIPLSVHGDCVSVELSPHQWIQVEVTFA